MSNVKTPAEGNTFIATYGSLRRGMQNFRVNAAGGGEYVGTGTTKDKCTIYRYSGCYFPSVSLKPEEHEATHVVVDVFEAPIDGGLDGAYDSLEGYPNFYNRTQVEIELDEGQTLTAWIYHIDEPQEEVVVGGDWCLHNNPNYYNEV